MSYNTNPWFLFISGSFITHLGSRYAQIYCRIIPALLHVSCKTLVTLFNLDASVYEFVKWNASIFFFFLADLGMFSCVPVNFVPYQLRVAGG